MDEKSVTEGFGRILYGGDYNPGQWPRTVWPQDMRLFEQARMNTATVNVFSWAKIQPSEEEYDFAELDDIMKMLKAQGYRIVLATATGALPAWMFKRYPEVGRVDFQGRRHKFGQRHNACPNSPVYQRYACRLAATLADRYGRTGLVACWHVNNEYGGECYCENCEKAFRVWLRNRYKTLDALNIAWNTEFWGHTLYDWDEVVAPNLLGDAIDERNTAFAGLSVDYRRFLSDSLLGNFKMERDAIRQIDADTPITTNLMWFYKGLNYFKWAREMDVVSWDNYPAQDTPWSMVAMAHDLMRGLKKQPFMLMEQTPSQQNWQPYNSLKRPGQMRAQSWQTIAHGGDTVQFFQLRQSAGGCEKFHGAVISHAGTSDTRVFREVTQLGKELETLGGRVLGAANKAQTAILFDWDNWWALEYTSGPHKDLTYLEQIHKTYRYFYERNIPVDMVPVDGDLSGYKVVCAPLLYMVTAPTSQALDIYVKGGGTLITGFMSGIVDESDLVHLGGYPGPLRDMAGIWVEESDALSPDRVNSVRFDDGFTGQCQMMCDIIHLKNAEALARYTTDFYAGVPAVTKNKYGAGWVYYIGTDLELAAMAKVLDEAAAGAALAPAIEEKTALEVVCRQKDGDKYWFVMNFTGEKQTLPNCFAGKTDLLSGNKLAPNQTLSSYDVALIWEERYK